MSDSTTSPTLPDTTLKDRVQSIRSRLHQLQFTVATNLSFPIDGYALGLIHRIHEQLNAIDFPDPDWTEPVIRAADDDREASQALRAAMHSYFRHENIALLFSRLTEIEHRLRTRATVSVSDQA